jgi:signal transduction histidine kinase
MRARGAEATDDLLRGVAVVVWIVVGAPSWTLLLRAPSDVGGGHPFAWCAVYLLFAVALLGATSRRMSASRRRRLLVFQSGAALALAVLGMPHFEGAAFAIVAAQAPTLMRPVRAIAWDVMQGIALFPIVLPSHGGFGAAKAVGEYATFALFALCVIYLRDREAAARSALVRTHAELLATQSLLADDARTGERLRVAREVHDAIGHGLTAASLHLQIAARAHGTSSPVAAAQEAVRETLAEVRGLVRAIRDDATVDLGTALRALSSGIREPKVILTIPKTLHVADPRHAHVLFRCVQEGLTNTIRHGQAERCFIDVDVTVDAIAATVRDDGVGADSPVFGSGLGGLRERLAEVSGTLKVESHAGAGLTLTARIPRAGLAQ